jgi:hypothetical protein
MRIMDNEMVVDLKDGDPRTVRIRAILFDQPIASDPIGTLWSECTTQHRAVLIALATHGDMEQVALERALEVTAIELRGRHSGLARIARRIGVSYPIRSSAGRRNSRRFSLDPAVGQHILKLVANTPRRKAP